MTYTGNPIEVDQMTREVIAFSMEEMRNRGIEEAARVIERLAGSDGWLDGSRALRLIRARKGDPASHMSDWWNRQRTKDNPQPTEQENWG
jgi:hypothetical protein